ncbi:MAG: hypothetical protein HZC02_03130 [Candidatus Levybacteria bacterium]|nr:hypothetical protein [Candidatus Levybacteria bacterium]
MKQKVIVFIILLLLFSSLFFLNSGSKSHTVPQQKPTPTYIEGAAEAKVVTIKFFQQYDSCVKEKHDKTISEQQEFCRKSNIYGSSALIKNVLSLSDEKIDPVICSSQLPSGYQVFGEKNNAGRVSLRVAEMFGTESFEVNVQVVKEKNEWKIDKIICS